MLTQTHCDDYQAVYVDTDTRRDLMTCPACGADELRHEVDLRDLGGHKIIRIYGCDECEREIDVVSADFASMVRP